MTWATPGKTANSGRWRYDLRKGFVPPGHATDPQGTQYELPQGYQPSGSPKGFHVVQSPPGTSAPIDAINYTPDTGEVHDVGTLAPVDKMNYSLLPSSGLQRLAAARRQQRAAVQGGVGAGADSPGMPPISQGPFSPDTQFRGSNRPTIGMPDSGMSATSAPPGSPYGRQLLGLGAGADANGNNPGDPGYDPSTDADATDPTVGTDTSGGTDAGGSPPSGYDPSRPADPNWSQVGPEYTGTRQVDPSTVAEFAQGKVIGYWVKKPGATDVDPNAWSFRAPPADKTPGVTYTPQPQQDGSIKLVGSNGDIRFVKPPAPAKQSTATQYGAPYVNQSGDLVQQGSNGEIRVIQRSTTPKPTETWGNVQTDSAGNQYQTSSSGQVRYVNKMTTAQEQWDPPITQKDGSIWQYNKTTGALQILQGPDTKLTDPITVGNRLVQFDPTTNSYKEVYRAPNNMTLQTQANGTIIGIDPETGQTTHIADDAAAAIDEANKQKQADVTRMQGEEGLIPQVQDVGGNLIVPPGAEADVSYWNPTSGQTTQTVMGQRQSVPDMLKSYGFDESATQPAQQPATYAAPPPQPQPQTQPQPQPSAPVPSTPATTYVSAVPPSDPTQPPPPDPFAPGSTDSPLSMQGVLNSPTPFAQSDIPEGSDRLPLDDSTDVGSGAEKKQSSHSWDLQSDLYSDIPQFSRGKSARRWKGIGSKYLGRGLDDFEPFVGVGQDSGGAGSTGASVATDPTAGIQNTPPAGPPGPPSPGGGSGAGQWNPQMLQKLLPLLLMLLAGSKGGQPGQAGMTAGVGRAQPPAPSAPAHMPPTPSGGMGAPSPGAAIAAPGAGAEPAQGRWRPPIDPQNVVGTGHKYGQKMAEGEPIHHGVDLQAPKGTPVKAPVDGVVQVRHNAQGLGNEVAVVGPDGKEHRLGHLNSVSVQQGQQVKAGQPIGTVGDTGLTTGANLHYDERKGNRHFDPSKRLGVLARMKPVSGTEMMTQGQGGIGAGAEAQDLGVGAGGMRLANGNWSDALADTPENQAKYGAGSGYQGSAGYGSTQYGVSGGGGGGKSGGGGGGGGGGGTQVGVDPATQARIQADLQIASQQNQTAIQAENDRHNEALTQLQQSAQQEADWKSVQDAVNAENARHNQATEQLQAKQQQLDLQLEQMRESSAMSLQQEGQAFQAGQTARQNEMSVLQSALSNPWIQALTNLGITPGGGASGGSNPLESLLNSILGGFGGATAEAQGQNVPGLSGMNVVNGQLPNLSLDQWNSMNPAEKASMRAQIEAMGPGMWQQFQTNFQNTYGNQAPDITQLQSEISTPEQQVGQQMNADMFGEGQQSWQQRQTQQWDASKGTDVMQSLLSGTGWG